MSGAQTGSTNRGNQADYVLGTAEGWDAFGVVRWHGVEEISHPFRYDITLQRAAASGARRSRQAPRRGRDVPDCDAAGMADGARRPRGGGGDRAHRLDHPLPRPARPPLLAGPLPPPLPRLRRLDAPGHHLRRPREPFAGPSRRHRRPRGLRRRAAAGRGARVLVLHAAHGVLPLERRRHVAHRRSHRAPERRAVQRERLRLRRAAARGRRALLLLRARRGPGRLHHHRQPGPLADVRRRADLPAPPGEQVGRRREPGDCPRAARGATHELPFRDGARLGLQPQRGAAGGDGERRSLRHGAEPPLRVPRRGGARRQRARDPRGERPPGASRCGAGPARRGRHGAHDGGGVPLRATRRRHPRAGREAAHRPRRDVRDRARAAGYPARRGALRLRPRGRAARGRLREPLRRAARGHDVPPGDADAEAQDPRASRPPS